MLFLVRSPKADFELYNTLWQIDRTFRNLTNRNNCTTHREDTSVYWFVWFPVNLHFRVFLKVVSSGQFLTWTVTDFQDSVPLTDATTCGVWPHIWPHVLAIALIFNVVPTAASMLIPRNCYISACVNCSRCHRVPLFEVACFQPHLVAALLNPPSQTTHWIQPDVKLRSALLWCDGWSAVVPCRCSKGGDGSQHASSLRCHRVNKDGDLPLCISAQRVWSWLVTIILPRAVWLPVLLLPNQRQTGRIAGSGGDLQREQIRFDLMAVDYSSGWMEDQQSFSN